MRIAFSIIGLIICMAVIFFCYNLANLETVKLENDIGSYSAVRVSMYDKNSYNNVNVGVSELSPNFIGNTTPITYFNESTLKIPNGSINYPNLTETVNDIINNSLSDITFNVLSNMNDLIIKIEIPNFQLPKEIPSNIPMTPQRFFELYPTGLDMNISNAKMSKIILGVIPEDDNFIPLTDLKVRVYCAPNPNGNGMYLLRVVPYDYLYEYNMFNTLSNVEMDLNAIKYAKPNIKNFGFDSTTGEQNIFRYMLDLFVYPIKIMKFYSTSAEILISDLSGLIFVNELEAYSPF